MEMSYMGLRDNGSSASELSEVERNAEVKEEQTSFSDDGQPEETPYTRYLVLAACTASLGGILFGYDLGVIASALIQLRCEFMLTDLAKEWVVTSMLVGALVASLTGGFLIDACGRRRVILVNSLIFICGAGVAAAAPSLAVLIVGRLILGFAISLAAISETVYIAEIAPSDKRGRLVTLNEMGIVLGFLLAYGIGYAFVNVKNGWRFMFAISALPAVLQGLGRLVLPASPRYLIINGQEDEARKCLRQLRGIDNVEPEIAYIVRSIADEQIVRLRDLLTCAGSAGRRLLIGGGLVFLQQMTGQPTILYYAPLIFQALGFTSHGQATLASVILGGVKFIVAGIALRLLDTVGRRRLLLIGVMIMTVAMVLMSTVITSDLTPHPQEPCPSGNSSSLPTVGPTANTLMTVSTMAINTTVAPSVSAGRKWFSLLGLVGYISGYQLSFGPCTWVVLTEIYPSQLRGRAVALATSLNWATNILISAVFLDLKFILGVTGLFTIYAAVCATAVIFVFLVIPETKNRTLEEISQALSAGEFKNPAQRCRSLWYSCTAPCHRRNRRRSFSSLQNEIGPS
ncbi:solute carrier family 2, facilitated glucose transporter member 12-like [Sycon ciliatum]|uniref:solute carrier family 2, facilitated glucose transporter member 12-like n=1 Tax=Sycon ciliatum TaxID=27933 RepID=UPI0020A9C005|eukprot:scpid56178/ scgid19060/ Solute carrier family 2, facilitated glucose transporter member 12; Glucose transporter type 12